MSEINSQPVVMNLPSGRIELYDREGNLTNIGGWSTQRYYETSAIRRQP